MAGTIIDSEADIDAWGNAVYPQTSGPAQDWDYGVVNGDHRYQITYGPGDRHEIRSSGSQPTDSETILANVADIAQDHVGANWAENDNVFWAQNGFVYRAYQATLDREAEPSGFQYWAQEVHEAVNGNGQFDDGELDNEIIQHFLDTGLSQSIYGGLDNFEFVEELFENALNRSGGQSGIEFWEGKLDSGTSRARVVEEFITSGEAQDEWFQSHVNFQFDLGEDALA